MKKLVLLTLAICCAQWTLAQPPKGKAKPGTVYGAVTDPSKAIAASELPGLLISEDTIAAKVQAVVQDVCSKKGCWLTFKVNDSTEAFVKMKDYGFFVPMDLAGKTVVLDGRSFIKTTSVEELRHYAKDAGKAPNQVEAITSPKKEIRFIATGIVVVQ